MIRLATLVATLSLVALAACAPAAAPSPTAAPAKPAAAATSAPAAPAAAKPAESKPAAAPTAAPAAKALADNYFAGKTVSIVVNFAAGGATDVFARLVAQYMGQYLPGKPTVIVQNVPGAGGVIGINQVYANSKKDGLTIGIFSSPFGSQVFGGEGVQYDAAKFMWLGGVSESSVSFTHKSLGIKTPQELAKAPNQIFVGGLAPDSAKDISERTFLDMLGAKYKYVPGYASNAEGRGAMLRGEINFFENSLTDWVSAVMPLVNEGTVFPMGQSGVIQGGKTVRDPRIKDIPTYEEVGESVKGAAVKNTVEYRAAEALGKIQVAMLRAIVLPPGIDQPIVDVMRKATLDTFNNADLKATTKKQFGFELVVLPGADAQAVAKDIIENSDKQAVEYMVKLSKAQP